MTVVQDDARIWIPTGLQNLGDTLKVGRLVSSALVSIVLGLGVPLVAATAANATTMVQCGTRTDYLKITQFNGQSDCFAYAGLTIIPPQLRQSIARISSGNNAITVTYYSGGFSDGSFYLGKWSSWSNPNPTGIWIKSITIH
ncbi:beta/gamma crystallin domain-containing protein [Arthrobacter silvisoli]|uniref:beta/gamma crystallin domain-containing protein n=1 Tax=Arthrobacter silvisoli TaxID=2291022 RepID=UPI00109B8026|nr:beta/gamma crystallin domain-containing protein [Arthrobacter silvisoli]